MIDAWSYELPPPQRGPDVRRAPCPYCAVEMVATFGKLHTVIRDGMPDARLEAKIVHAEPTCYEWDARLIEPEEIMEAFLGQ